MTQSQVKQIHVAIQREPLMKQLPNKLPESVLLRYGSDCLTVKLTAS